MTTQILPVGTPVILSRVKKDCFRGKRGVIVRYFKTKGTYRVRMTEPIQNGTFEGKPWMLPADVSYDAEAGNLDVVQG